MPLEARARLEAVLKQTCQQRFLPGQRRQAVADVARGLHPQLPAQHAAAAAVVRDRHDRRDVAAVALQATEQGGEAGTAADRHDVRAPVQAPLRHQGIHQHRVLFRRQGLLDRAEAAALAQPDQGASGQQHQGTGYGPRQHLGDVLQQPADRLQHPVDRLQIRPDRCAKKGQHQADAGGQHPPLHHQTRLKPAGGSAGAADQVLALLVATTQQAWGPEAGSQASASRLGPLLVQAGRARTPAADDRTLRTSRQDGSARTCPTLWFPASPCR